MRKKTSCGTMFQLYEENDQIKHYLTILLYSLTIASLEYSSLSSCNLSRKRKNSFLLGVHAISQKIFLQRDRSFCQFPLSDRIQVHPWLMREHCIGMLIQGENSCSFDIRNQCCLVIHRSIVFLLFHKWVPFLHKCAIIHINRISFLLHTHYYSYPSILEQASRKVFLQSQS